MATQTSNLGLTKPAYSETADIADINNNMDKVDAAVHGVQNGMAILANGNVHSAVTSGQYVYVRNHGTLAEGLYTATTNISTNATLSTSNLTAVPNNGALNTLRDDITSLNSNIVNVSSVAKSSGSYQWMVEVTGFQYNASSVMVSIPFPFIASNRNYTVNVLSFNLVGTGAQDVSNVTVDSKNYGSTRLMLAKSGTQGTPYSCLVEMKVTL